MPILSMQLREDVAISIQIKIALFKTVPDSLGTKAVGFYKRSVLARPV